MYQNPKNSLISHQKPLESSTIKNKELDKKSSFKQRDSSLPIVIDNYDKYDDTKDFYGLAQVDLDVYGDRCSDNHEKIRIISKSRTQIYWLTLINEQEHDGKLFIEQQIP